MPSSNGEKRLLYWVLGGLLTLLVTMMGIHMKMTADALDRQDARTYELTREVAALRALLKGQ